MAFVGMPEMKNKQLHVFKHRARRLCGRRRYSVESGMVTTATHIAYRLIIGRSISFIYLLAWTERCDAFDCGL